MSLFTFNSKEKKNYYNTWIKSNIFKVLLYCFIICFALYVLRSIHFFYKTGHFIYDNRYYKRSDISKIVTFGSSHLRYGIHPDGFRVKLSNLGTDGDDVLTIVKQIKNWISFQSNKKHVLLEFDNIIFSRHIKRFGGADQDLGRYYMKGLGCRDFFNIFEGYLSKFKLYVKYYLARPYFRLSNILKVIYFNYLKQDKVKWKPPTSESRDGISLTFLWKESKVKYSDGKTSRKSHDSQYFASKNYFTLENYFLLYDGVINELLKIGHKVSLVRFPHQKYYYNFNNLKLKNRDDVIESFGRKIINKYGIDFYDYRKSDWQYKEKLFYDGHHLNERGALKFSSEIDKLIFKD
jgi:hypothetical protein